MFVYRRGAPRHLELPPKAVAKEKYLYVIRGGDEAPDDSIERMIADHIESPFTGLRNRLVYGPHVGLTRRMTDFDRDLLTLFLAFQQLRTPHFRDTHNWMASFYGTMMARGYLNDPDAVSAEFEGSTGKSLSPADVREIARALDDGRIAIDAHQDWWLATLLKQSIEISHVIRQLPWELFEAPEEFEFVTCDNPVVVARRGPGPDQYRLGGGWLEPDAEVTFALSPRVLLVIGKTLGTYSDIGSQKWCLQVNQRTIEHAYQAVFARTGDDSIRTTLEASKGPEYTVDFAGRSYPMQGLAGPIIKQMAQSPVQEELIRFGPKR